MTKQKLPKVDKKPDEIDYLIAQVLLDDPTVTDQFLSDEVFKGKVSRIQINKRRRSSRVQNIVMEPMKHVRDYIIRKKIRAVRKIAKHIDSLDERISLKASEDFIRPELEAGTIEGEGIKAILFHIPARQDGLEAK